MLLLMMASRDLDRVISSQTNGRRQGRHGPDQIREMIAIDGLVIGDVRNRPEAVARSRWKSEIVGFLLFPPEMYDLR